MYIKLILLYIHDFINFFKAFSSIFPDLLSINSPLLNTPNDGYPEISYCSIISSKSSPFIFINLASVISFEILANYNFLLFYIKIKITYYWSHCFTWTTPSCIKISDDIFFFRNNINKFFFRFNINDFTMISII